MSMLPFKDVKYHLPDCLSSEAISTLSHVLDSNGATRAESLQEATHVITNSHCFEGYHQVLPSTVVVTEKWVDRSMVLGKPQSPSTYSPDPSMLFSGVVGCATNLRDSDVEIISAGITALGGQWRAALSKDVTHLFAISPGTDKYENAITVKEKTKMKVILPHWFDDTVRLGLNNLETEPYEWPDPPMLKASSGSRKSRKLEPEQQALLRNAVWGPEKDIPKPDERDIFGGRSVLLGTTLELNSRRGAVEAGVERTGGVVIDLESADPEEEADKIDECDVFITRYRSGKAYFKAVRAGKTIGTLAWLFHVQSLGVLTRPLDQLLHYPIPKKSPENFSDQEVTVSNYTGEAREYLKKLIEIMDAKFTPSMSKRNRALIAAHDGGQKAKQAVLWNIPVVNHLWLEDCFIKWRFIQPAQAKYLDMSPGHDFSVYLGSRAVGSQIEDLEEIIRQEAEEEELERHTTAASGTQHSARDVTEVARELVEAEDWDGNGAAMDVDETSLTKPALTSKRNSNKRESRLENDPSPSKRKQKVSNSDAAATTNPDSLDSDHVERDVTPVRQVNGKTKAQKGKSKQKGTRPGPSRVIKVKTRGDPRESTDDERPMSEEEDHRRMPPPGKKIIKTPTVEITPNSKGRAVSTVTPISKLGSSPAKGSSTPSSARKSNAITRNDSIHVTSPERRRPSGPSTATVDSSPMSVVSATSRVSKRAAATRASQLLHEEIMPDVLNFQQEMKRKGKGRESIGLDSKRRRSSTAFTGPEDEADDIELLRPMKREKSKSAQSESASEGGPKLSRKNEKLPSDKDAPSTKKRKSVSHEVSDLSDNDTEIDEGSGRPQKKRKMATTQSGNSATKTFRLMTTQVKLSPDDVESLNSMGVKMTAKPPECTHLVVPQLVRTEKFLCALARSPFILTVDWVRDSISAGRLLREDRYLLKDEANEKKHGFRLVDALSRAKQHKGALFRNKRFYVTPKVEVAYLLLKNVVEANGGQVSNQQPTQRILDNGSDNRFVISCPKDASIWRPLAEKYPIYTSELILTAALKHEIEWDNDSFKVPGSF